MITIRICGTTPSGFKWYELDTDRISKFKKDKGLTPSLVSGWKKDDRFLKWTVYYDFETFEVYGINAKGYWFNSKFGSLEELVLGSTQKGNREATNDEILKVLKTEAAETGFVKGAFIDSFECDSCHEHLNSRIDNYDSNHIQFDALYNYFTMGNKCIMLNGKWATVVNTEEDELKKALQAAQDALENYKNK